MEDERRENDNDFFYINYWMFELDVRILTLNIRNQGVYIILAFKISS